LDSENSPTGWGSFCFQKLKSRHTQEKIRENPMKFASWYGISVGALIILQWIFFLLTGSVPELQTVPLKIDFHISAELLLALILLISGIATIRAELWGRRVLLIGIGMAICSEINSPGYFAQLGQWELVLMFAVLLMGAILSAMFLVKQDR
jgi:hypothetical protein